MNKKELATAYAKKLNCSEAEALRKISAFVSVLVDAIVETDSVKLIGFGTFSKVKRAARRSTIPNGQVIDVPERTSIKFVPGKEMKKLANNG